MTTTLAFLFVLGVLVFVHELGHFLVARWYGVRVLTFSLGFGPKLVKVNRGGTEYCISVVPLGGYVKLAGETVEETRTGAPDEFLSKSKWIRFQVYLAGPAMNVLLAFVVVAGVLSRGADVPLYQSSAPVIGSVQAGSVAQAAGLEPGDRIVRVEGKDVATWDDLQMAVAPKANRELTLDVSRAGTQRTVAVTPARGEFDLGDLGIDPVLRPQIMQVVPGSPAEKVGLQAGDVILGINGARGISQQTLIERIRASGNTPVTLAIERSGAEREITVTPELVGSVPQVGISIRAYEVRTINPTLLQAMKMSAQQNWETILLIGHTLHGLVTREVPVGQLVGPVGIAQLSGTAASLGFIPLLNLLAMISVNLGVMNLIPVPILDGGQIAILAIEGFARRDLSAKVKERILMAGAALIVLLMVTVIFNDISRLVR